MRVVIQRVSRASVTVDAKIIGEIEKGFLVLLGITHTDTESDARWLAEKVAGLRLFEDENGKMNQDLDQVGGSILVVSQFTLYGDAQKGRRPSFVDASGPEHAIPLYEAFINALRALGITVATGQFGAMMQVELVNDGPVTLIVESKSPKTN